LPLVQNGGGRDDVGPALGRRLRRHRLLGLRLGRDVARRRREGNRLLRGGGDGGGGPRRRWRRHVVLGGGGQPRLAHAGDALVARLRLLLLLRVLPDDLAAH